MRHLAIGDIHGCFTALITLAQTVRFCSADVLITLGDYVNRGPDSRAVLDWLIEYRRRGTLIALRGNHEIMMLRARESEEDYLRWIECGGDATLSSYSHTNDTGKLSNVPGEHWDFLENHMRSWYETKTHFFVHANAYPNIPLEEQPDFMLYWESFDNPLPHESGKVMVCGHTPQKSGRPKYLGHAVCIDTWASGKGWLTCLDVESNHYWQANQQGESRSDWLLSDNV